MILHKSGFSPWFLSLNSQQIMPQKIWNRLFSGHREHPATVVEVVCSTITTFKTILNLLVGHIPLTTITMNSQTILI
jgi:hypothetical protein